MKVYNKRNCQYQCRVTNAFEICSCIPWDFPLTTNLGDECDVFGRTCFYNAMKQINLNETGEPSINNITAYHLELIEVDVYFLFN